LPALPPALLPPGATARAAQLAARLPGLFAREVQRRRALGANHQQYQVDQAQQQQLQNQQQNQQHGVKREREDEPFGGTAGPGPLKRLDTGDRSSMPPPPSPAHAPSPRAGSVAASTPPASAAAAASPRQASPAGMGAGAPSPQHQHQHQHQQVPMQPMQPPMQPPALQPGQQHRQHPQVPQTLPPGMTPQQYVAAQQQMMTILRTPGHPTVQLLTKQVPGFAGMSLQQQLGVLQKFSVSASFFWRFLLCWG
jgi:hypothetical protein